MITQLIQGRSTYEFDKLIIRKDIIDYPSDPISSFTSLI